VGARSSGQNNDIGINSAIFRNPPKSFPPSDMMAREAIGGSHATLNALGCGLRNRMRTVTGRPNEESTCWAC